MLGYFADFIFGTLSVQTPQIAAAEHIEPVLHAALALDRRRPVEQAGLAHLQAVPLQHGCVLADAWKPPTLGTAFFGRRAENSIQCLQDNRDVALAAEFGDEAPTGP